MFKVNNKDTGTAAFDAVQSHFYIITIVNKIL